MTPGTATSTWSASKVWALALVLVFALLLLPLATGCASQQGTAASSAGASAEASAATDTSTDATAGAAEEDVQYVLYIGTNDKDTNEPVYPKDEAKELVKSILIKNLGGYTIQEAEGGWIDESGKEFQEYTLVVYLSDTDIDTVHKVCDIFIEKFDQSSILIQCNKTETEFYAGA